MQEAADLRSAASVKYACLAFIRGAAGLRPAASAMCASLA